MHKCINNSIGNVYHLEQFVSDFFPYSQEQLGFDKPVTIRFESDQDNAGVMLGKTAYYDPSAMEIALYVDGRHPKDVMRSLSHELVHHAQNCRGDFTAADETGVGYAQEDPHLRKMEREAYTKGNLIFRDFEDLIKTGKINIEIDFSDSGEPKMSLKEWKNNEINRKLMKKWGLLKEDSGAEERRHAEDNIRDDEKHIKNLKRDEKDDKKELEEGSSGDEHYQFDKKEREDELEESKFDDMEQARKEEELNEDGVSYRSEDSKSKEHNDEDELEEGCGDVSYRSEDSKSKKMRLKKEHTSGKISVREAKEITRRIIERIKKENS